MQGTPLVDRPEPLPQHHRPLLEPVPGLDQLPGDALHAGRQRRGLVVQLLERLGGRVDLPLDVADLVGDPPGPAFQLGHLALQSGPFGADLLETLLARLDPLLDGVLLRRGGHGRRHRRDEGRGRDGAGPRHGPRRPRRRGAPRPSDGPTPAPPHTDCRWRRTANELARTPNRDPTRSPATTQVPGIHSSSRTDSESSR